MLLPAKSNNKRKGGSYFPFNVFVFERIDESGDHALFKICRGQMQRLKEALIAQFPFRETGISSFH